MVLEKKSRKKSRKIEYFRKIYKTLEYFEYLKIACGTLMFHNIRIADQYK